MQLHCSFEMMHVRPALLHFSQNIIWADYSDNVVLWRVAFLLNCSQSDILQCRSSLNLSPYLAKSQTFLSRKIGNIYKKIIIHKEGQNIRLLMMFQMDWVKGKECFSSGTRYTRSVIWPLRKTRPFANYMNIVVLVECFYTRSKTILKLSYPIFTL